MSRFYSDVHDDTFFAFFLCFLEEKAIFWLFFELFCGCGVPFFLFYLYATWTLLAASLLFGRPGLRLRRLLFLLPFPPFFMAEKDCIAVLPLCI